MTWLRSEGIHPLPALDGGLGKSAGEKVDPEETLLPGKVSATIQKVRRSEGQKVRRSEGQKVRACVRVQGVLGRWPPRPGVSPLLSPGDAAVLLIPPPMVWGGVWGPPSPRRC